MCSPDCARRFAPVGLDPERAMMCKPNPEPVRGRGPGDQVSKVRSGLRPRLGRSKLFAGIQGAEPTDGVQGRALTFLRSPDYRPRPSARLGGAAARISTPLMAGSGGSPPALTSASTRLVAPRAR